MLTIYSDQHRQHSPRYELFNGELLPPVETPDRLDSVLNRLKAVRLGEIAAPMSFGPEPLLRVHTPNFVKYLQTAWGEWSALGRTHDVLPFVFSPYRQRTPEPQQIDGKAGFFAFLLAYLVSRARPLSRSKQLRIACGRRIMKGDCPRGVHDH